MDVEEVHRAAVGVLEYVLSFESELEAPDWDMTAEERDRFFDAVASGQLLYFIARVDCCIDGLVLASDYLGGCCYKSVEEFLGCGYYAGMKARVKQGALVRLEALERAHKTLTGE